ncbi:carboxylesterase family protein [bacterium]|nr:carboxylesterase family protein [bacterium]
MKGLNLLWLMLCLTCMHCGTVNIAASNGGSDLGGIQPPDVPGIPPLIPSPTPNPNPSPTPSPSPICPNFTMPPIVSGGMPIALQRDQEPFALPQNTFYSEDVAYGSQQRTWMDVFLPESSNATAVIVYIHGGGFSGGDKDSDVLEDTASSQAFIQGLLNQNIAFIRANYSFLQSPDNSDGVFGSLQDIKRLIQFIRYHHQALNINPEKIGMIGRSAGAGAATWMALHDDMMNSNSSDPIEHMPTRIQAAISLHGQASYDLMQWETVFPGLDIEVLYNSSLEIQQSIHAFYTISDFSQIFSQPTLGQRQSLDFLSMTDDCDPPVQLINLNPDNGIPTSIGELNHHPNHAQALYNQLIGSGNTAVEALIPAFNIEDPVALLSPLDFFIRELN